jgi:hypothetical protein
MLGLRLLKGAALGRLERAGRLPSLPARAAYSHNWFLCSAGRDRANDAACQPRPGSCIISGESLSKYFSTSAIFSLN